MLHFTCVEDDVMEEEAFPEEDEPDVVELPPTRLRRASAAKSAAAPMACGFVAGRGRVQVFFHAHV